MKPLNARYTLGGRVQRVSRIQFGGLVLLALLVFAPARFTHARSVARVWEGTVVVDGDDPVSNRNQRPGLARKRRVSMANHRFTSTAGHLRWRSLPLNFDQYAASDVRG
jgi:hypothetical protein